MTNYGDFSDSSHSNTVKYVLCFANLRRVYLRCPKEKYCGQPKQDVGNEGLKRLVRTETPAFLAPQCSHEHD